MDSYPALAKKRPRFVYHDDDECEDSARDDVRLASYKIGVSMPSALKLPWETGFAGQVFGNHDALELQTFVEKGTMIGMHEFNQDIAVEQHQAAPLAAIRPAMPMAVRTVKLLEWSPEPDDLRRKSLDMVRLIIESDLSATNLGTTIHSMAHTLMDEYRIRQTIDDSFARKSTATLYKRVSSFWKFYKWNDARSSGCGLAFKECDVYDYVSHLRDAKAGATSAKTFLESVNFFHALVGFTCISPDELMSPRVQGVAHILQTNKRPLSQARPLALREVKALEDLVLKSPDNTLAIMAGFFMFCLTTCCRFSDAQNAVAFDIDQEGNRPLINSGILKHKTATSAEKKTTLLPLVGFARLFLEMNHGH